MFGWEVWAGVAGRGFCTDSVGALLLLWAAGLQALGGVTGGFMGRRLWHRRWSLGRSVTPVVSVPFSGHLSDLSK